MSEDERPREEQGQDELIAAFAALGGPLTRDEFMRLLGSDKYYGALVRLAAFLLDGDTTAAGDVARDSLDAGQDAWSRLGDPEKAHVCLRQIVVNRSRSVRRRRAADDHDTPQAVPGAPGAGHAGIGNQDPQISALRALPDRQREAVVLRNYMGLSEKQAAQAMGISIGAVRSHLARGMSSLQIPPNRNDRAKVAEPSPDAGAAVHRALRHRSAGLPAQLACDADLRAAGTITALGVHDPRHGHVAPRMRP